MAVWLQQTPAPFWALVHSVARLMLRGSLGRGFRLCHESGWGHFSLPVPPVTAARLHVMSGMWSSCGKARCVCLGCDP